MNQYIIVSNRKLEGSTQKEGKWQNVFDLHIKETKVLTLLWCMQIKQGKCHCLFNV